VILARRGGRADGKRRAGDLQAYPVPPNIVPRVRVCAAGRYSLPGRWPTETGLRGWACEIRTQKCRRKLSP
jgi:hypothetical protein